MIPLGRGVEWDNENKKWSVRKSAWKNIRMNLASSLNSTFLSPFIWNMHNLTQTRSPATRTIAKKSPVMWKTDLLGQHLLTNTAGELTTLETTAVLHSSKTIVALLFSALWCPPCEQFLKDLIVFYYKIKSTNSDFEIVLISSDKDDKQFQKCE